MLLAQFLTQIKTFKMCWMCGCADHVGLGNERVNEDLNSELDDIRDK